jgi:hypothetical protein
MKQATISLVVVDQYLDDTIFDLLESLDDSIQLKILTGKTKPILKHYINRSLPDGLISRRGFVGSVTIGLSY